MKAKNERICITTSDVEIITGNSYRTSLRLLHAIAAELNKDFKFVTIDEFCDFTRLNSKQVKELLFK